jgi:hypothetical protein
MQTSLFISSYSSSLFIRSEEEERGRRGVSRWREEGDMKVRVRGRRGGERGRGLKQGRSDEEDWKKVRGRGG